MVNILLALLLGCPLMSVGETPRLFGGYSVTCDYTNYNLSGVRVWRLP
jgi:hypothetical protein